MLKNYFKTAIRNLMRYKGFSFINILSLAIGVTGCLVIGLFIWDEWQYDKSIPGSENIYRIYGQRTDQNATTYQAPVPPMYTTFLQQQYPEVDTAVRIMMTGDKFLMEAGETTAYEEKGRFVDASFFQVFPFKFLRGDPNTALTAPATVVLTEELAQKYFGNADPLDKTIKIDTDTFTVKGVLAPLPSHLHIDVRYLMSLPSLNLPQERMEKWTWTQFYTYVKLKPGVHVQQLQEKFQSYIKKEIEPQSTNSDVSTLPFFQPLKDVYLHSSEFIYDYAKRGNATYVKGLTIIALFVLLIACFNFINLATARSFRRAKEIGVRKVVGADRKQLVVQFIGETVLLSVFAVIIAIIATFLIVPYLNSFTEKNISFNLFSNPMLLLLVVAAAVLIGIFAGIYPAIVLSGFKPIKVLKSTKAAGKNINTGWLRQGLVVVQFALSALLIISSIIVYRQTKLLNNKDLGFNKEQLVFFQTRGDVTTNLETFKSELLQSSSIVSVTSGYGLPGDQFAGESVILPGSGEDKDQPTNMFIGDHDYVKTLGLNLVAGRDFTKEMSTDIEEAFIINETAVKEFGFGTPENALGQPIHWDKWIPDSLNPVKKGRVIGVVQDFHYKSLHEKVTSSVIQIYPPVLFKVAVKLKTADVQKTIAFINETWNKFSPQYPLDYKFMDETYEQMYKSENKLSSILWIFTFMAIVVGCMGLFALAAFTAEQRTKEIGIRKILGASVLNIVGLLSKNFLTLVFIASLIAFPVAWWAMNNWLEDFPYRVSISWWVFGITAVVAVIIALLTISFQAIKVATANPVKSLRTE
ncbi:MAG: ABC transporter permease [Flavisolibacter sp.]|nr:ABC transporter permease [Flavisolibacter sp.]